MNPNYLDFEQPLAELEAKISELRNVSDDNAINIDDEIQRLEEKLKNKTTSKSAQHWNTGLIWQTIQEKMCREAITQSEKNILQTGVTSKSQ